MSDVTNHKNVSPVNIEDEMRGAYLDYAMSVIIGRALPDVRDGLKPVHRRVLYAMHELGNSFNKPYKKSARVVGDVIGKYHPHGDQAVYDTIVRMAQDFALRYTLIDGQGNFGSIDGDSAAAMRYTEVRMQKLSSELLADLEKDTVDFGPNYDDSLTEPKVFPAKFPNLLVNGAAGIAVGMATNIPPHNLTEVINATMALIQNPELSSMDLMEYVKGPDFPTKGFILGNAGIKKAYTTGKGSIMMRGRAEIEPGKGDREKIIITELPYQVNKAKFIEKIAQLVRDKKIEGISDLRDESNRDGIRVVVDLKKGENSNIILNRLYKLTPLQQSFGITLLGIHQNQPKVFKLNEMLWAFIEHRKDVVLRRTAFELRKAEARAHILEGLKIAVENLDDVIKLIRSAQSPDIAKKGLVEKFSLSLIQAQAILDMRLHRLTGLERQKIVDEYEEILKIIAELKAILASEQRVFEIITDELEQVRNSFGDERQTEIVADETSDFEVEDLVSDEDTLVTLTHRGYIKRSDPKVFKSQGRGGKGLKGMTTQEGDFATALYHTTTLSYLLCVTNLGRLHWLKVYKIPETGRTAKGKAVVNLVALQKGETIRAILPVKNFSADEFMVMCTKKGVIKKTALSEFKNVRTAGVNAISIKDGDELVSAKSTQGSCDVFIYTKNGKSIRFQEDQVRPMGRTARGVTGMKIDEDDCVVALETFDPSKEDHEILVVSEYGYGKRTPVSEFRAQTRGGKGVVAMKTGDRKGAVVSACQVLPTDEVMIVSTQGKTIRLKIEDISEQSRYATGVRLMTMAPGEKVATLETMAEQDGSTH
ncbi:MAG: DNA gyrase subunit A [Bdellovibrionaceae bacterium]|nr:DNA gyrase subunit A [Pseudobdellovibrionaceae bacterium]|tara:strand:+ start:5186 stop:7642 length:2457 start_codon:yes stop_codon:yes gene_type:complete